jgi:hypothetical protein
MTEPQIMPLDGVRVIDVSSFLAGTLLLHPACGIRRRDAPATTASITRSRKSSEYGFGIGPPISESI